MEDLSSQPGRSILYLPRKDWADDAEKIRVTGNHPNPLIETPEEREQRIAKQKLLGEDWRSSKFAHKILGQPATYPASKLMQLIWRFDQIEIFLQQLLF